MTRWLSLCVVLAGCASAGGGAAPDASTGGPPDASTVNPPDADLGPDADTCVPMTEECDGDDDDCDDVADNGCACTNGTTQPCYTGNTALVGHGVCAQGTQTCVDGAWSPTCAGQVLPSAELCNTFDDDCDDTPDDGNPEGGSCNTGLTGICAAGTRTCTGGVLSGCVQNNSPSIEVCNGLDDDCNVGTADGFAETWYGDPCDGTDVDSCSEGLFTCTTSTQACSDSTGDSNRVADGGYEASLASSTYWTQASTQFGTPLCDVTSCGTGPGTYGPRTGAVWSWLGGTTLAEDASTTQSLTIPTGTATLTFYLSIPACATGGGADTFTVTMDGATVFSATNADVSCGSTAWAQKSINVSAYANGGSHTLGFRGVFVTGHTGTPTTLTNFFVDDIRLEGCP